MKTKKKKGLKSLRSDLISVFCRNAGKHKKKRSSLRFYLCFLPKSRWRPKKRSSLKFDRCFKKRISATHNLSAEASINQNQPTQKPFLGHLKTFGGPLLARGPRVGRPWSKLSQVEAKYFKVISSQDTSSLARVEVYFDQSVVSNTCRLC